MSLVAVLALAFLLGQQAPSAAPVDPSAAAVRDLVAQYYEAQTNKDPDKSASFWSQSANPRMSRDAFVAVFGAGDAQYTPDIQSIKITGNEARVRLSLLIARTIVRNDVPMVVRQTQESSELWRREGATWKLMREGPAAEDFADALMAAPAADRSRIMQENPAELTSGLRYVLAQRASRLAGSMQYAAAREIFLLVLDVARTTNDRRSESEALQNIANAFYFLQQFDSANEFYQQRLALSKQINDEEGTAASLLGLATVAYSRGEYTPALASYREALALYEKRDEGPSIGRALVSVGNVQYLQAEYDAAAASYRRALGLLTAGFDREGASFAQSGLGRVFTAQGDLAAALDMYGQVLKDARLILVENPRARGRVAAPLEAIGEIYFRLGNMDQARTNFDESRKLYEGDPGSMGRISASLGLTELVAGRFEAALAAYTESRTRFEQAKQPDDVARAWVGIGFCHAAREKYDEAMTAYRTAIKMFDANKREEDAGRAWLGLSMAQSSSGDNEAALVSAVKVRAIATAVGSADLSWRAAVRAGEALRKLKRLAEARQEFGRAIQAIDTIAIAAAISPEARGQLDDSASAWSGLALTLTAMNDARGALDAIEARRAHARRVQLAPFQRDISRGMTPEEEADEQAIVRDLISVRAQVRAERNLPRPDQARLQRLQEQLTGLAARREEQQTKLYVRLPELQQWRALQPTPFDVNVALANARSLVVEYLVTDDELLTVTMVRGEDGPDVRALTVPFKRRELADQLVKVLQPGVLADADEWRKQSSSIAVTLLGAIGERFAGRDRCTIVPDDLLWKIPFEALTIGDGPLAARMQVGYATSLAAMTREAQAAADRQARETTSAALFAAPVVPDAVRTQLTLAQTGWKAPEETATLRATADDARPYGDAATIKSSADATEPALRAALATADVLHVAAPFHASGASPLFSMVVLGGAGEQLDNDGRWEVREWFRGTSRAAVAVLADGSSFGSAGVAGAMDTIAWASASLGVPVLVVGRWPAEAFSNDAVFAEFHAALAKGTPAAAAWVSAVNAVRAKNAAPAAWAGARLIGAAGRE